MSRLLQFVCRSRALAEARVVVGGALVGAGTGLAISIIVTTQTGAAAALDRYAAVASGLGYGWWGGLLFSVALALTARHRSPVPAVGALLPAVAIAAGVLLAVAASFALFGLAPAAGVPLGVAAGAVAARLKLRASTLAAP